MLWRKIQQQKDTNYEHTKNSSNLAAKAAGAGCKLLGRQGVTWAGKIALKIYPPILQELTAEVRKDIFVVCGTNGKTTTNNMLCAALGGRREQSYLQITPDPIC